MIIISYLCEKGEGGMKKKISLAVMSLLMLTSVSTVAYAAGSGISPRTSNSWTVYSATPNTTATRKYSFQCGAQTTYCLVKCDRADKTVTVTSDETTNGAVFTQKGASQEMYITNHGAGRTVTLKFAITSGPTTSATGSGTMSY